MDVRAKKHVPLVLSALALLLAVWWAWTTFWDTADSDPVKKARVPSLLPEVGPDRESPVAAPAAPASRPPELDTRPPPDPPPPERIVPETVRPEAEDREEPVPGEPVSAEDERRGPPDDLRGTSGRSSLLGGVARTNARATEEVEVPAGRAWIGSALRWVQGTERAFGAGTFPALTMEAPRFAVRMERFFVDRFEVSNFRYWEYLRATARVTYRTGRGRRVTLADIARTLVRDPPENLDFDAVARQLYEANRGALRHAFRKFIVTDRDGVEDEEATWRRIRDRRVPGGLRLEFYDRAPPGTWPSDRFPEREIDHPVRDLSVEEAIGFALYHGRHLPTEIEWEYVARGPYGLDFPWDAQGRDFPSHVNGGDPLPRGDEPKTVPITHLGQGASWIGVFQLLGNVSEWTSSFLDLYPNGTAEAGITPGTHVVVRGGSANDRERVPVRPAFRGWRRDDPPDGPRPNLRLPWTGFRTARHVEIARSRLPTMHYRARRAGHLDPRALEPNIYAGEQGVLEEDVFFRGAEEPSVRPGVKTFVAQPLRAAAIVPIGDTVFRPHLDHGLVHREDLLDRTRKDNPVLFGLFHNDLPLTGVWIGERGPRAAPLHRPGRFVRGDCPPGTWFIAVLQGEVALLDTDLRSAYYLTKSEGGAPPAVFNVRAVTTESALVWLGVRPRSGRVDVTLQVPMGDPSAPGFVANLRLRLDTDARASFAVENWREGRVR